MKQKTLIAAFALLISVPLFAENGPEYTIDEAIETARQDPNISISKVSRTSKENRESLKYYVSGEAGQYSFAGILGANLGYRMESDAIISVHYLSSNHENTDVVGGDEVRDDLNYSIFGGNIKKFLTNSFYVKGALSYEKVENKKTREEEFIGQPNKLTTWRGEQKSLVESFSIGNEWQWENFSLGFEWIGLNHRSTFNEFGADAEPEGHTDGISSTGALSLNLLRLSVGYGF